MILPCPFCGHHDLEVHGAAGKQYLSSFVLQSFGCINCGARGPLVDSDRIEEAWNRRTRDEVTDALVAEVARLEKDLKVVRELLGLAERRAARLWDVLAIEQRGAWLKSDAQQALLRAQGTAGGQASQQEPRCPSTGLCPRCLAASED